jgi:hypothetical protein
MLKASPDVRFSAQRGHRKPFARIASSRPATQQQRRPHHHYDGRQRTDGGHASVERVTATGTGDGKRRTRGH